MSNLEYTQRNMAKEGTRRQENTFHIGFLIEMNLHIEKGYLTEMKHCQEK